jgi:hypothetical protein
MAHFEFGQDRLTQPQPLNAFDLAQGAIKGAFVLFSTTLLGLIGSFCEITLFAARAGVLNHAAALRPQPSRQHLA